MGSWILDDKVGSKILADKVVGRNIDESDIRFSPVALATASISLCRIYIDFWFRLHVYMRKGAKVELQYFLSFIFK